MFRRTLYVGVVLLFIQINSAQAQNYMPARYLTGAVVGTDSMSSMSDGKVVIQEKNICPDTYQNGTLSLVQEFFQYLTPAKVVNGEVYVQYPGGYIPNITKEVTGRQIMTNGPPFPTEGQRISITNLYVPVAYIYAMICYYSSCGTPEYPYNCQWNAPSYVVAVNLDLPDQNPPEKKLSLVSSPIDFSGNSSGSDVTTVVKGGEKISFKLGERNLIKLVDSDGDPISATYKLVDGSAAFLSPINASNSLFPDRVAVLFSEDTTVISEDFVPVHLGTQQLLISPTDAQYSPRTVTISVLAPDRLGSSNNDYDSFIVENANQRGLPPQLIKSIIAQESTSKFIPTAYRYEPKTSDLRLFQKPTVLANVRYRPFIFLPTKNDMALSVASPRSIYKVSFNGKILQNIPNNYETDVKPNQFTPLMARNIFENNNSVQNWFIPLNLYEMNEQFKQIALELEYQKYNFIAQTAVASSYGLMQLMYMTAIEDCNFRESNGAGKSPIQLFDPSTNINCGSRHFLKKYNKINSGISITDFSSFESNLRSALAAYNGGVRNRDAPEDGGDNYHSKVWKLLQKFSPLMNSN